MCFFEEENVQKMEVFMDFVNIHQKVDTQILKMLNFLQILMKKGGKNDHFRTF